MSMQVLPYVRLHALHFHRQAAGPACKRPSRLLLKSVVCCCLKYSSEGVDRLLLPLSVHPTHTSSPTTASFRVIVLGICCKNAHLRSANHLSAHTCTSSTESTNQSVEALSCNPNVRAAKLTPSHAVCKITPSLQPWITQTIDIVDTITAALQQATNGWLALQPAAECHGKQQQLQ